MSNLNKNLKISTLGLIAILGGTLTACGTDHNNSSSQSSLSSESSASYSSESSSSSSVSSSVAISSSSSSSSEIDLSRFDTTTPNHYEAPKTSIAPTIDGVIDDTWAIAPWEAIDVPWREDPGVQTFKVPDSPADFSGRYKAIWTEDFLYLLVDITDDILHDNYPDPFSNYHHDDTVEIFLDEDNGREQYQGSTKAFAFHVSTLGDNIYNNQNLKDLIEVVIASEGTRYIWEMKIKVVGPSYNLYYDDGNDHTVDLYPGKTMGFTASYIDNDGGSSRESFIGSVDSELHHRNQGYINSASFGTMTLVE